MLNLSNVTRLVMRIAFVAFGITTASLLLLFVIYVGDILGYTSVPETDAGSCFPRTAVQPKVAWWGGFYCQAGYGIRGFGMNMGNSNNSGWYECGQEACNNPVPPWKAPIGSHDQSVCPGTAPNSSENVITGWACDPDNWNATLQVEIYRDGPRESGGTKIGEATANQFRQDLVNSNVCGSTGNHGFTFQIPEDLRDNASHNYYVYAIDDGSFGNAGNPLLGGSPKAATCTIPPPTSPSASCNYNPARNLFEAEYRWTAPSGYNTFYTRIRDTTGNLSSNPGWRDDLVGTTHRFDLSNAVATNPGFATNKDFTYWIHTRWLHPSDPNNPSLWRMSAAVPVAPDNTMTCPLPDPLTPNIANATCVGSFTSTNADATFNAFAEFSDRYNLEYTPNGGSVVLLENQPALLSRNLPWGRYTWRVQGENRTDTKGPWSSWENFQCLPPSPVISITASPNLITSGTQANLNWTIQANYEVNCTLTGGGTTRSVNHSGTPLQTAGSITTDPIINTTDFRFSCTPNIAALPGMPTVEQIARVEVVPLFKER